MINTITGNIMTMHRMGATKEHILISSMSPSVSTPNQSAVFVDQNTFTTKRVMLNGTGVEPLPAGDSLGNFIPDVGDYGLVVLHPSGSIARYDYKNDALLTTPVGNPSLVSSSANTWYYDTFNADNSLKTNILKFPDKIIFTTLLAGKINHVFELLLTPSLTLNDITSKFSSLSTLKFTYVDDNHFMTYNTATIAPIVTLKKASDYTTVWSHTIDQIGNNNSYDARNVSYIMSNDGLRTYIVFYLPGYNVYASYVENATGTATSRATNLQGYPYVSVKLADSRSNRVVTLRNSPTTYHLLNLVNAQSSSISGLGSTTNLIDGFVDGNGTLVMFTGDSSTNKLTLKLLPRDSTTWEDHILATGTNDRYAASLMWDDTTLYLLYPYTSTVTKLFKFGMNQAPGNIPITVP